PVTVTPADFVGSFNLWCDGEHATLNLVDVEGTSVRGTLREANGHTSPVTASIDPNLPYQAAITVENLESTMPARLSMWMFVRPRTALAGWLDWGATRLGCYMIRMTWR